MNIGNKIKELRKQRGVTQEQLANSIGISFQAVSKWENNIALPDIMLAPLLANYFGVSMDELFDYNLKEVDDDVEHIVDEAYKFRKSDPERSRQILMEGLKKYPENDILLNNLLYVLNYSKDPDETIAVAGNLLEKTTESDIKYDSLRFLAYAYKAKGDLKSAKAALNQIPEIYFTKLTEMTYLLDGEAKLVAASKQKWISFEHLVQMMLEIAECYEADGDIDRAIYESKKALQLITIMEGKCFDTYAERLREKITRLEQNL